ncbi:MAG: MoxR family ATPase [Candidatus Micrarchaeia archaeon]|jgi:MoxR-like ATPase
MAIEAKKAGATEQHLDKKTVEKYSEKFAKIRDGMKKAVVGQEHAVDAILRGLIANGHVLIEGYPGVAKTLIMMSMATLTGCKYKRIQFTPDMLPSDITGVTSYSPEKGFYTIKGPVFTNFVLADEINRAPAKVQSALLEAMQEKKVTIGSTTYDLDLPFVVLATQNNIESLGVYPLPAAQLDRFMFKINMGYPEPVEERTILRHNITSATFESLGVEPVMTPSEILEIQSNVKRIYCTEEIEEYIVSIVHATRDHKGAGIDLGRHVEYGGSPRASIAIYMGAQANAMMRGRTFVTPQDVKDVAHDVLRHRIILNYEGQAEMVSIDALITEVLEKVRVP